MIRDPVRRASLLALALLATVVESREYSLPEVLASARTRADEMAIADLEYRAGEEEVTMHRSNAMPSVAFSSSANYFSQSLAQSFSYGSYADIIGDRLNGGQLNWNLSLRQPLVTFGRVSSALRIARVRDSMLVDTKQLRRDLFAVEVLTAFAQAYLAQNEAIVAEKSLEHASKLVTRLTVEVESGGGTRTDLLRVQAQERAERAALITARSNHRIAVQRLVDLSGIDTSGGISLVLGEDVAVSLPDQIASGSSIEVALKRYEADMYRHNIRGDRSALLPSLYLTGLIYNDFMIPDTSGMTSRWASSPLNPANQPGAPPGTSSDLPIAVPRGSDYFNPDYFNYSIGVQLTWNIFDGRRSAAKYRQTRVHAERTRLEQKKLEERNRTEINEARDRLAALSESLEAAQLGLEAAGDAYAQAQIDYEGGFLDLGSLLSTEKQLRASELAVEQIRAGRVAAVAGLRVALGLPVYEGEP